MQLSEEVNLIEKKIANKVYSVIDKYIRNETDLIFVWLLEELKRDIKNELRG